ncbi:shikimate kinase protein [Artemisia annua]|uniref:Shikimate kinase protein n=1 Tax=Artemisia annua TaxID=35608 RepID=A0A2U1N5E1_ARTAN|nr:shikimate kinase protein [Artemisia annua]
MEAKIIQGLHLTTWISSDNTVPTMSSSMRLSTRFEKTKRVNMLKCDHFGAIKPAIGHRAARLKVPCTSQNFPDVPLDALAKRLTAIGTASRPLLHHGSGDAYTQTFKRLCKLWEERSEAYSNAQVTVSLERIASKLGHEDVCSVNPTQIAIEALIQIEEYLKKE